MLTKLNKKTNHTITPAHTGQFKPARSRHLGCWHFRVSHVRTDFKKL